ncbi:MAG: phosphopantetheine-binding protein [Betaproteobacteria bacterium]
METIEGMTQQEHELAALIVHTLNLDVAPEGIDVTAPLYRDGLGLDSIDILEVALAISKTHGFQLRSDDGDNARTFSCLRSLNQYVQQHRAR